MRNGILKTTTALALVVSLANPALAQDALDLGNLAPEAALEIAITERAEAEAAGDADRVAELDALIAELEAAMGDEAPPEDSAVEGAEPAETAEPADPAAETAQETPAPEAAEDTAADAAPAEEAAPEAAEDTAADAAPAEEAAPEAAQTEPAPGSAAEEPVTEIEADTTAETATPPAEEDASAPAAEAETEVDAETELDAAMQAQTEGDAATSEGSAEAETEAQTNEATEAPEAAPAAEADASVDAETQADTEAESADFAETSENTELPEVDPQAQADAIAEDDAAASAAAAAAASEGDEAPEAEVVEETVTEETARSSSEEFETSVADGAANAEAARTESDDDDDDNDRQEEILRGAGAALLGLGALAVGDLLRPNEQVVSNTGDRIVVERDGQYRVLRNDDALLRQPGSNVTTYRFEDGSTRSVVVREDGSEIETIRAADGRVLRRTRTLPSGEVYVLFDDTQSAEAVDVSTLPEMRDDRVMNFRDTTETEDLAAALARANGEEVGRTFSLNQIRNIDQVRKLMPQINVDTVNFETGSAVIRAEEAEELSALGRAIREVIDRNPSEVFLIEGHTDAVGSASYNLALSDRRAESVALALTEYFDVPPENMVIQGYGESDLLVATQEGERANRRAAVRRITPLLQASR